MSFVDFNYDIQKVKGLDCPTKFLVIINGINVCFTNSKYKAIKVLKYAYGEENAITNNKIKKKVKLALANTK